MATIVLGVVSGLVAVLFHVALEVVSDSAAKTVDAVPAWLAPLVIVAMPALAAWIAGVVIVRSGLPVGGSGIPQVKAVLGGTMKPFGLRVGALKALLCSIQIGGGGSLGREGPTVQICGSLVSAILKLFSLPRTLLRRFLPVSAAAGIAAAFNTPVAAVTFVLEEMLARTSPTTMTGLVVAAAIAAIEERMLLGGDPMFHVPSWSFDSLASLPSFLLLGVFSGYVGVAFHEGLLRTRMVFKRSTRFSIPAKMALGGLIAGAIAFASLSLFSRSGIAGPGYALLNDALDGDLSLVESLALLPGKLLATIASYSSGGAGGIFTPVLALGSLLGSLLGQAQAQLPWADSTPVGAFALVGMGALFAAVIRAPMTSVLIIFELTGNYGLILPLMLANMASFLIARSKVPIPVYEALMAQDGLLPGEVDANKDVATVGNLMQPAPLRVAPDTPGEDVAKLLSKHPYLGVDLPDGRCGGIVFDSGSPVDNSRHALDLVQARTALRRSDPALPALALMARGNIAMLPVVDDLGILVGVFGTRAALSRLNEDPLETVPI